MMDEKFRQIRQLLAAIETKSQEAFSAQADAAFLELELIAVVRDVVDYLQPLLTPYQSAFYWHLFRHSFAANGLPLLRVSTRGLRKSVVKSARSDKVSLGQVQEMLAGLEAVGAIRKEGEPNREGTLYRVFLPDQIEVCKAYQNQVTTGLGVTEASDDEADYYNIRANRKHVYERDSYLCKYCNKQLTLLTATLDHVVPVAAGGSNSSENLVTACRSCNSRKNRRPVGDFLAEDAS